MFHADLFDVMYDSFVGSSQLRANTKPPSNVVPVEEESDIALRLANKFIANTGLIHIYKAPPEILEPTKDGYLLKLSSEDIPHDLTIFVNIKNSKVEIKTDY